WDQALIAPDADNKVKLNNSGGVVLEEGNWFTLEDGIQIHFQVGDKKNPAIYRSGDYWLIPARTATGDIEWLRKGNEPMPLFPHGVEHHYAPLAIITLDGSQVTKNTDLRYTFKP